MEEVKKTSFETSKEGAIISKKKKEVFESISNCKSLEDLASLDEIRETIKSFDFKDDFFAKSLLTIVERRREMINMIFNPNPNYRISKEESALMVDKARAKSALTAILNKSRHVYTSETSKLVSDRIKEDLLDFHNAINLLVKNYKTRIDNRGLENG